MTSTSALSPKRAPADATAEVSELGRKELRSFQAAASSEPLRLESIALAFGGVSALKDINLAVAPGEIRAIIGPNGAGKSSLLNVISGIYRPQHAPTRCTIPWITRSANSASGHSIAKFRTQLSTREQEFDLPPCRDRTHSHRRG